MWPTKHILHLTITMVLILTGCGKKAVDEIDLGTVKNNVYLNDYFSMSLTLPEKWSVSEQQAYQQSVRDGQELSAGDDENLKLALKAAEPNSIALLCINKHPLGAPVPFNPMLQCIAERIQHAPGIVTGRDYLFHVRRLMEASALTVSFPKDISVERIGGKEFGVLYLDMSIMGEPIRQKIYATIIKGYALMFIAAYVTEDENSELDRIIETLTFK